MDNIPFGAAPNNPTPHNSLTCGGTLACPDCNRAWEEQCAWAQARTRRRKVIGDLARAAGCQPEVLVEVLVEIAQQAQGGDHAR